MAIAGKTTRRATTGATEAFFEGLAERGHEPLLRSASGTLRVDLDDGGGVEHWYVTIKKGDVIVSHRNVKADAVVHTDKALFHGMVTGEVNATAAALRGVLFPEGDMGHMGLFILFQRLFPGPPGSRGPGDARRKR